MDHTMIPKDGWASRWGTRFMKKFAPMKETAVQKRKKGKTKMSTNIAALAELDGFVGACLVDSETGLMLASEGGGKIDLESASALNTQVVKAKLKAIETLKLSDVIEDILITLGKQYHLIRPLSSAPTVFLYLALDRKSSNLGLARIKLKALEATVAL